jgi:hypothetical protein
MSIENANNRISSYNQIRGSADRDDTTEISGEELSGIQCFFGGMDAVDAFGALFGQD